MKAAILLIGTELLNGGMIDTNSIYIAEQLNRYGIEIEYKMMVRDVISEIKKALAFAKKNVDLIITTGGLGPTDDDITKEAIAKFLKKKLIIDEKEKKELMAKYKERKLDMKIFKEVEKPEGAISFKNDVGMAPACAAPLRCRARQPAGSSESPRRSWRARLGRGGTCARWPAPLQRRG